MALQHETGNHSQLLATEDKERRKRADEKHEGEWITFNHDKPLLKMYTATMDR